MFFLVTRPLEDGDELELKTYLENLYITASQYDDPPTYPVSQICNSIEEAAARGDDTIDRIASAVNNLTRPGENSGRCLELSSELRPSDDTVNGLNWLWQVMQYFLAFDRKKDYYVLPRDRICRDHILELLMKNSMCF